MRLIFMAAVVILVMTLAGFGSHGSVQDFMGYASSRAHAFAKGDTGDSSGWRGCNTAEESASMIGVVCDGKRTVRFQNGEILDVNFSCDFQFEPGTNGYFKVVRSDCQ